MLRNDDLTSELSSKLNDYGYYSILLTYHSRIPDNWIKCANLINLKEKIKYMIAVRTYAISPEYCAMMCESFNRIANDRLMLNIVSGDLHKGESSVDDVILINDYIKTQEDRVIYTRKFMEKFINMPIMNKKPEIVITGRSDYAIETASKYGDYGIMMLSEFLKDPKKFDSINNKIVSCSLLIRETDKECEEFLFNLFGEDSNSSIYKSTIYGSIDTIKDKIWYFKNKYNINDFLINLYEEDTYSENIHQFIKNIEWSDFG
ncbi:Luciferase-like domain containing protein [uncultured Caudovirales phage]|uniref:Luciferase-like domain containing protein n=1 Tax=uncultured Caudovirales phage TaxID=2100421 RepID=A0A6J5QJU2_9CAUD|nr:Luciferase-like domain containing protein [uncultured Caudovirales phage]CAB4150971.1 Luciferase-like domain containing protein [uncultured Caudovirales phage]CAB4174787.1 Luciferase-like domain containing protein [uncultured Caudovirales phage]CAB4179884.1 Luciferase-like domain containing protein [uncultured Caudovirales phage]CAB4185560.1 Luciferase-like domain containing protein [uncultured Caudovirales phage]